MIERTPSKPAAAILLTGALLLGCGNAFSAAKETPVAACFELPVEGYQPRDGCLEFLDRNPAYENRRHVADDFCAPQGTEVRAAAAGRVMFAQPNFDCPNWGHLIAIEHTLPDGSKVTTLYGHTIPSVAEGSIVAKGQKIGAIGRYSCWTDHVHFAVYRGDYGWPVGAYAEWMLGYLRSESAPVEPWTEPVRFILDHSTCPETPRPATVSNANVKLRGRNRLVTVRFKDPDNRRPAFARVTYEYRDPTRQLRTGTGDLSLFQGSAGNGTYRWLGRVEGTRFRFYTEWRDAAGNDIRYPATGWAQ